MKIEEWQMLAKITEIIEMPEISEKRGNSEITENDGNREDIIF